MPGHQVHDLIGAATAVPMTAGVFTVTGMFVGDIDRALLLAGLFCVSHIAGTYFLSPDLDLDSRIYRRWGPLRFLWKPYKDFVSHRGNISHTATGGLLRIIYFLVILCILATIFTSLAAIFYGVPGQKFSPEIAKLAFLHNIDIVLQSFIDMPLEWACFLLGAASSSWIHVQTDKIGSRQRRFTR